MKLKLWMMACLLMLGMSAQAQQYKYETVAGDLTQTRLYTLDNGLKVYLSVNKERPRIDAHIAVRTGSRNDPAETTGLAHYLEHIMFKGTKQFGTSNPEAEQPYLDDIERRFEAYRKLTDPQERKRAYHEIDSVSQLAAQYFIPNEYDKLMSAIGAQGTNAYTSNDVTCYTENIPSNEVENWARIQADRFQNMVIRGFHTELEAVYEEKNIGMAQDNRKVWEAMNAKMFPSHPYGTQTTIGTQEHLKNPSITNIWNYYKRYYVPNNIAICMAGDFNPDEVIRILDKHFGSWKKSETLSRPEYAPQPLITAPIDTTIVGKEAERLMMGWRFDAARTGQVDTLEVIGMMLANGRAGLFEVDLEQPMKVQGASAYASDMDDYSMFLVSGTPKQGQSLEELRALLLEELDKFKRGEFSDDLLPSVKNNIKRDYYRQMQNNRQRVSMMVDAFIEHRDWKDVATRMERLSTVTKQELVDFANRYIGNNFVCVYKRTGTDDTQKKIEKPEITPIPTNRELSSAFLNEIKNTEVAEITPRFVDFNRDLTVGTTKKGLPLLYKHNDEDGLFTISFMYDFGTESNNKLPFAADYLEYVGTNKQTVAQIKQALYKLACDYNINIGSYYTSVNLSGLSENMAAALAIVEEIFRNAAGDNDSWSKYVDAVMKARGNNRKSQQANFSRLTTYAEQGAYNAYLNAPSESELRSFNPQNILNELKQFAEIEHTVLYYGPMSEKELNAVLSKNHRTAKKLQPAPKGREYRNLTTPQNEVYIAPYEAKNIYMMQYHNEDKPWNVEETALVRMFNEYFGGGMNSIVFQELREARGLAYSASARYSQPTRPTHSEDYYTYIVTQNDKMPDCVRTFNQLLENIPESQQAFDIAKQSVTKSLQTARTTKYSVLSAYYWAKKRGLDYDINEKVYQQLPGITLQDVLNFEKKNMTGKTYKYIILGDEKELDMDFLKTLGTIHRLTTDQIFE